MTQSTMADRLAGKTPEAAFVQVLEQEFHFSPRLAQEVLNAAQAGLVGERTAGRVRPGQIRQVVASLNAAFGPSLADTAKVEVTLTVDAGREDGAVKEREGATGLRQGRILRLVAEALEQGGVMTQEDLARVLGTSRRTIARDVQALKAAGHVVATRGTVKGVGRGQTHKVRIIELWLDREGYDKIARWVHHSPQAIKRYVNAFLRILSLHQQDAAVEEIAFLTQTSVRLVEDYLTVYHTAQQMPHRREKLAEELARVQQRQTPGASGKKGAQAP
jgi:predicted transcriptional regulator